MCDDSPRITDIEREEFEHFIIYMEKCSKDMTAPLAKAVGAMKGHYGNEVFPYMVRELLVNLYQTMEVTKGINQDISETYHEKVADILNAAEDDIEQLKKNPKIYN